ncbi:MAG: cysteine--tRNA ligase [Deltaproteobacteria bacterium]|nr:cysteine--tRNA ligase [Deltaproteobacteria bacterium]
MQFYDTMAGKKVSFESLSPNKVGIYVCGPTVYDYCHLGHARAYVAFDVIVKHLRYLGNEVTYVRNFTDIDDKIIARAAKVSRKPTELADQFIEEFHKDMDALKVARADVEPRVSQHVGPIILLVQKLIDKEMAYVTPSGNVYYAVRRFADYGKLSRRNPDDLRSGSRVAANPEKRDPIDFVLWKKAKPGEPKWESPWGEGRPGWHIECSAMSMEYLGTTFDIHGGGKDLVDSMHHENEIAQSQGANGPGTFAKHWIHNGFVQFNGEKMSKSLGNFFTIRELLGRHDPESLRYFLLTVHYRGPINFEVEAYCPSCGERLVERSGEEAGAETCPSCGAELEPDAMRKAARFSGLEEADARLEYVYETLSRIDEVLAVGKDPGGGAILSPADSMEERFREAMDNDFNTAAAIAGLSDTLKLANRLLDVPKEAPKDVRRRTLAAIRQGLDRVGGVLGLWQDDPSEYLVRHNNRLAEKMGLSPAEIEDKIRQRTQARKNKEFERADAIRQELLRLGVELRDGAGTTQWRIRPL